MPNYTDQQVTQRAGSGGKDSGRKATADKLYNMATQPPHEDDAAARQQLAAFSGLGGSGPMEQTDGWATADARNYGKMKLAQLDPNYHAQYDKANDGAFKPMHALGGLLKYGAPIAASLIPGVGPLAAAGIAAAGTSAGNLMKGDGFDLKSTLLSGAAGAGGNALLGGQGVHGLGGIPQRIGMGGGAGNVGNMTQGMAPAAQAASSGPGLGGVFNKIGGLGGVARAGIGVAGILDSRAQRHAAERMANAQLGIRQGQLDMAEQEYASRAPLRNAALGRLGSLAQSQRLGSSVFGGSIG